MTADDPQLERLRELRREINASDADLELHFEEAVEALDRAAAPRRGAAFERVVLGLLAEHGIVSRNPVARGALFHPDFLAKIGDHTVLVEAKAPTSFLSRQVYQETARELANALDAYEADKALLVVPDTVSTEGLVLPDRVAIVHVGELSDALAA